MKKTLMSILTIGTIALVAYAGTTAFFSDEETSTGNTFQAGAIDLLIDSEAHYNGMVCTMGQGGSTWQPEANVTPAPGHYPAVGTACGGTWASTDLDTLSSSAFFNYSDIKPGDTGENTLSITVKDNDAYVCMHIGNMQDSDNDMTEPEGEVDLDLASGELAENLHFTAWLDQGTILGFGQPEDEGEGDNKWQGAQAEPLLFSNESGPASDVLGGKTYTLADANSVFDPFAGGITHYIGLQWCAGTMTIAGDAISCNGASMGNEAQTDSLTADIHFYAEQSRNNPNFSCANVVWPTPPEPIWTNEGTITGGNVSFVDEDPRGTVLQLTTIDDNDSRVRWVNDNLNHVLATFSGVSFDSKQVAAIDPVNGNASMRLFVDLDGDINTPDVQEITYEPYYNIAAHNPLNDASILANTWQTWNTTLANGKFWANEGFLGSTPGGGAYATNFTLAQVNSAYPSARIVGISLGMGTYNRGQVVLVDNLIVNGSPLSLEN